MKLSLSLITILISFSAFAKPQISSLDCAKDAIEQTEKILRFHWQIGANEVIQNHEKATMADVTALAQEMAPDQKGSFDVLEVETYVYKASYTARFIYAKMPALNSPKTTSCVLMG